MNFLNGFLTDPFMRAKQGEWHPLSAPTHRSTPTYSFMSLCLTKKWDNFEFSFATADIISC